MEQDKNMSDDAIEGTLEGAEVGKEEAGWSPSEDCSFVEAGDIIVRDMPEIKVLEHLKNTTGSHDVAQTIKTLFNSMQNMDAQLQSVLKINATLEADLKTSKELIAQLRAEKSDLEATINRLNEEMPSKRELKAEIDRLIEERNEAQTQIKVLKDKAQAIESERGQYQRRIEELQSEKQDLLKDITYLEQKLSVAMEKLDICAREINTLRGERMSNLQKIEHLKAQYDRCKQELERVRKLESVASGIKDKGGI